MMVSEQDVRKSLDISSEYDVELDEHCHLGRKLRHFHVPGAPVMHGPVVTKADFYEACERYFPEHDIVFTHSRISDRRFTDCMVGEKLVMRYCPPDKYDVPQTVILFPEGMEPLRCMLQEELWTILKNLQEP